ncbi:MAG: DUF5017 domain-containing protein [Adhaeribacter sp.]
MMKLINYYSALFLLVLLTGCDKEIEVLTPEFEVSTPATTYQVGEEVTFQFSGEPDNVSMYTGEVGNDYAFKDGRVLDVTNLKLSFNSHLQYGSQKDMFFVMASTDFNGDYSSIDQIRKATWTDITNRFTLATTTTYVPSGAQDISDLAVEGKPLYLAFRYRVRDQDLHGAARTWRLQAVNLSGDTNIGTLTLADLSNGGWRIVDEHPAPHVAATRTTVITSQITLTQATTSEENKNIDTETWVVSKGLSAKKIDRGPDRTIPLKGNISASLTEYKYAFSKAGNYQVYFIASNNNAYGSKQVVKQVNLTITE